MVQEVTVRGYSELAIAASYTASPACFIKSQIPEKLATHNQRPPNPFSARHNEPIT